MKEECMYPGYKYKFDINLCPFAKKCDKQKECVDGCGTYKNYYILCWNSMLPKSWWLPRPFITDETFTDYEAHKRCLKIKCNMVDFVDNGMNLVICGKTPGTGKTHMAIKLMLAYLGANCKYLWWYPKALFISIDELFTEQRNKFNGGSEYYDYLMQTYADVDLIVWDDIGVTQMTATQYELLFTLINKRILAEKSNIFTTNKTKEELPMYLGTRLYSRIIGSSETIEFKTTEDIRVELNDMYKQKAKEENEKQKENQVDKGE